MSDRERVMAYELSCEPAPVEGLEGYDALHVLVRLHGTPLETVRVPIGNARCSASALRSAILAKCGDLILHHHLRDALSKPLPASGMVPRYVTDSPHPQSPTSLPTVTVAVCTRDRTDDLEKCLVSIRRLDPPPFEVLVVDNAPSSDATYDLVRRRFQEVRYVREPRPGLDWARNRAITGATGEILAFTDDDAIVDRDWVRALSSVFAMDETVMAVTGLVMPFELETRAQILFEAYGGFGRGFRRQWFQVDPLADRGWLHHGAGRFGTGANMAFRRSIFDQIGQFDPALDVGTSTNGGGDLEMFFRVLQEGYLLVYEPAALVLHRHRRQDQQLRQQLVNNGIGFYSFAVRSMLAYPSERRGFVRVAWWWLSVWISYRLASALLHRQFPPLLVLLELWGAALGLTRYPRARKEAAALIGGTAPPFTATGPVERREREGNHATMAVRTVELCEPVSDLADVAQHTRVRVYPLLDGRPLGGIDIVNRGQRISAERLRDAIADQLAPRLLDSDWTWWEAVERVTTTYAAPTEHMQHMPDLPLDVSASIVVATRDRPEDLRNCLRHLSAQRTERNIEIVVVDNNPASGLTPPVLAEFPEVRCVDEPRRGLSYARNAGIIASRGDIIVMTDDDVTMPADWLEKLLRPFAEDQVMLVTGNVLPLELDTPAQRLFEVYGGLGRGFEPMRVDGNWFRVFKRRAVPTWHLGATANAAARATAFKHPAIGLLDEALGAGMSGVGEDTYLFYKVLKAGYTIVYEPAAYVWHRHRRDMRSLRRQIFDYSKGHVAYHLTTVLADRDIRGLLQLAIVLPRGRLGQLKQRLRGNRDYPVWLMLLETAGNLAGPWALWRARQRVKREGRAYAVGGEMHAL